MSGVCAITGASGYVGSRVAERLTAAGWSVRRLGRSGGGVRFDLTDPVPAAAFDGADALVHLAYDFSCRSWRETERVNVGGSRRLFAAARAAGIETIVCISTVAAFPGARSNYGRAKLEIERAAFEVGACVVRPGLVWGPDGGAMFGALERAVNRLPVVPLPAPAGLEIVLVNEDDLAELLARILASWPGASGELVVAASEQPLSFDALLRSLVSGDGHPARVVRLPWRLAWLGLRALELVGLTPPFRSDSLVSLVAVDADPLGRASTKAERFGVHMRPYVP
jgi:nucleoside-diphosphate-sugar epimerase